MAVSYFATEDGRAFAFPAGHDPGEGWTPWEPSDGIAADREPAHEDPDSEEPAPEKPSPTDSKPTWEAYAAAVGVDPDGMTKVQIIAAVDAL